MENEHSLELSDSGGHCRQAEAEDGAGLGRPQGGRCAHHPFLYHRKQSTPVTRPGCQ